MRGLLLAGLLVASGPALACTDPTLSPFNADPTNRADSAPAFTQALGQGGVEVCVPPGNYRIGSTISVPAASTFRGAGTGATIFHPMPGFAGDLFQVGAATAGNYLTGVTLSNFRIYSGQNLPSGVGIHVQNAQIVAVLETEVDGMFGAYECDGCINTHFTHANSIGANTSIGAFGYAFQPGTVGNGNPSEVWVESADVRGLTRGGITYPMYITAGDGIWLSGHFGFSSGPALVTDPATSTTQLTGVHCTPCVLDTATDGVYVTGSTTAPYGNFQFVGSSSIIMSGYGVNIDATGFLDFQAPGYLFNQDQAGGLHPGAGQKISFPNSVTE